MNRRSVSEVCWYTPRCNIETYKYNHPVAWGWWVQSPQWSVVSEMQNVDLTPRVSCFGVSWFLSARSPNYKRHQIIFHSVFWFASARSSLVFIFLTLVACRLYTEMISSTAAFVHLRTISTHGATGLVHILMNTQVNESFNSPSHISDMYRLTRYVNNRCASTWTHFSLFAS